MPIVLIKSVKYSGVSLPAIFASLFGGEVVGETAAASELIVTGLLAAI